MATKEGLKQDLAAQSKGQSLVQGERLTQLVARLDVRKRFEEILGDRAAGFISSVISVTQTNKDLALCDPNSVLASAVIAATLDLPINPNLGMAAIVPYKSNGVPVAQFQMMARGFIQLGQRTGQYKTMNASEIYEDEIEFWNPITGEIKFRAMSEWKFRDEDRREKIVGYVAFFELMLGFRKYLYMTVKQLHAHGKRYSKSYFSEKGKWQLDFHSMALKTVIKLLLSKFGPLSIDVQMQRAIGYDQGVARSLPNNKADAIDVTFPDGTGDQPAAPEPPGGISEDALRKMEEDAKAGGAQQ